MAVRRGWGSEGGQGFLARFSGWGLSPLVTMVVVALVAVMVQVVLVAGAVSEAAAVSKPDTSTEAGALKAAESSGTNVEVTGQRSETREVYARPDGLLEGVEHLRPVRTLRAGQWVATDPTLKVRADKSVAPVASSIGLTFSGGGDGPLVQMTRRGRQVTLTWPGALPVPTLEGATATYANVFADVDLKLKADVDSFSQVLVVKTPEAAADPRITSLKLALKTDGLQMSKDASGNVSAVDAATAGTVFYAQSPVMWDSTGQSGASPSKAGAVADDGSRSPDPVDGPSEGATVAPIAVAVDSSGLTLTPDHALLTGSETNFPVYIDPTWWSGAPFSTDGGGEWGMVGDYYSNYKFTSSEGVGFCDVSFDSSCGRDQLKRLFYKLPIGSYVGKQIHEAYFVGNETGAAQCPSTTSRSVQLWRPQSGTGFGSNSTWGTTNNSAHWNQQLTYRDVTLCSGLPAGIEFHDSAITNYVTERLNQKLTTIYFGLKATSESDMLWYKRFSPKAELHIFYNTRPDQPPMTYLHMISGGRCTNPDGSLRATQTSPAMTNELPALWVDHLTDPDAKQGDTVKARFGVSWDAGDGQGWKERWLSDFTAFNGSGSAFHVDLKTPSPAVTFPQNTLLGWHVNADDGKVGGPSSWQNGGHDCYFKYNTSAPAITVNSTDYPPPNASDPDDPPHGGVGRYGTFTVNATGVSQVSWVLNGDAKRAGTAPVTGGVATFQAMPTSAGTNDLEVTATNGFGTTATKSYQFRVGPGTSPAASWKLDDAVGSSTLADSADKTGGRPSFPATPHGTVTLGQPGRVSKAITLDGSTGYAGTSGPVMDSMKSYSVAAWVKLNSLGTASQTAVSQDGPTQSSFFLKRSGGDGRWQMFAGGATAESTTAAVVGQWTHLIGVYDTVANKVSLYVDGVFQASATITVPSPGQDGPAKIGRAQWNGGPSDAFNGSIDDVHVWDRVIGDGELSTIRAFAVTGRWRLNAASGSPLTSANELPGGGPVTLAGQASIVTGDPLMDPSVSPLQPADGVSSVGSLSLNQGSTNGDSASTGQTVDGSRSFSISTWVFASSEPGRAMTAFNVTGTGGDGLTVRYLPGTDSEHPGRWEAELVGKSSGATASTPHLAHFYGWADRGDGWQLVTVAYDANLQQFTLYINGASQDNGDGDTSVLNSVTGFAGAGPLRLGRDTSTGGNTWSGRLDDLWLVDGAMSFDQVTWLNFMSSELDVGAIP